MAMEVVYTFFVSTLTSKYGANKSIGLKVAKYGRHFEVKYELKMETKNTRSLQAQLNCAVK